jgi:hypothetical protein
MPNSRDQQDKSAAGYALEEQPARRKALRVLGSESERWVVRLYIWISIQRGWNLGKRERERAEALMIFYVN